MKLSARVLGSVVAAAVLVAGAYPAGAVECVNVKGNRGCWATLQEAVDAAAEGETIRISPGWYQNQQVVVNKNGVTLLGAGRRPSAVIIDAGRLALTDAIAITADNVTVRNLSVRNSAQDLVDVTGANAKIVKVWASGADVAGINIAGPNARIVGSRVTMTGDDCVQAIAAGFFMQRTRVASCASGCIDVTGAGPTLIGNSAAICESDSGVIVAGPNATIRGNRINGSEGNCLDVSGDSPKIIGNDIDGCFAFGIYVDAATAMTVSGNTVSSTDDDGVDLTCNGCTGPNTVAKNVVRNTIEDDDGFVIVADGPTQILNNRALYIQDYGFTISGAGPFTIRGNQAREIGGDMNETGFLIFDTSNAVVTNNVVTNVLGYGIEFDNVVGSTLRGNRVDGCWASGIRINESGLSGDNNTVENNVVRNCLEVGFQIEAGVSGTTLTSNRALLTNWQYCDEGTGTTLTGNNFTTSICPL